MEEWRGHLVAWALQGGTGPVGKVSIERVELAEMVALATRAAS